MFVGGAVEYIAMIKNPIKIKKERLHNNDWGIS
jgi:hypothetical protein